MGVYQRGDRFYLRWTRDGQLVRKSLGDEVRTRAQAEAAWRKLRAQLREGRLARLDPSRVTIDRFRQIYLDHRRPLGYSLHTIRRDDQALRSLAEVIGGRCLLRSINQRKIDQWAGVLLGRGVSPRTVNSYLRHIRAAMNKAVEWEHLAEAPKLRGVREPKRLARHLTPEQVDKLFTSETNEDRRRLWQFLVWTGLRRQEVIDLTWQRINVGEKPFAIVIGKGNKERLVPLLPKAVEALGELKDVGPVWVFKLRGRVRRPKPDALSHWFKDAARLAGLPEARLHDLRHTAATYLISKGVSVRVVQEVLGHASITTTEAYAKALVTNLYDEMSKAVE